MQIYVIVNRLNGKKYIGQTIQTLEKRWRQHCWASTVKTNMPIAIAIKKYGKENFQISALEICSSQKELDQQELYWAKTLNTFSPNGYNLKAGNGPGAMSQETRDKIRKSNTGRYVTKETRRRLSIANTGHVPSKETRAKISANRKGRPLVDLAKVNSIKALQKQYELIDPNGRKVRILNLRKFCAKNKLHYPKMNCVANNKLAQYKGWKSYTESVVTNSTITSYSKWRSRTNHREVIVTNVAVSAITYRYTHPPERSLGRGIVLNRTNARVTTEKRFLDVFEPLPTTKNRK